MANSSNIIDNIIASEQDQSFTNTNSVMLFVDGKSSDPIENVKAIKVDQPVHLLACTMPGFDKYTDANNDFQQNTSVIDYNSVSLSQMGIIIPKTEAAVTALQKSFVSNGKLANKHNLLIYKDSILTLSGNKLPKNLVMDGHSKLILDGDANVTDTRIGNNSNLYLEQPSKIEHAVLKNVTTGELTFDNRMKPSFNPGSVCTQILPQDKKNYFSVLENVNLGDGNYIKIANLKNATLDNCQVAFADYGSNDSDIPPMSNIMINSVLDNSVIHNRFKENDQIRTVINSSMFKDTSIYLENSDLDIIDSNITKSTLTDYQVANANEKQYIGINKSEVDHLVSDNIMALDNAKISAPENYPLVTSQSLNINKAQLIALKPKDSGVLRDDQKKLVVVTADKTVRPKPPIEMNKYELLARLNEDTYAKTSDQNLNKDEIEKLGEKYSDEHQERLHKLIDRTTETTRFKYVDKHKPTTRDRVFGKILAKREAADAAREAARKEALAKENKANNEPEIE